MASTAFPLPAPPFAPPEPSGGVWCNKPGPGACFLLQDPPPTVQAVYSVVSQEGSACQHSGGAVFEPPYAFQEYTACTGAEPDTGTCESACEDRLGATPDCPTPAGPGACQFVHYADVPCRGNIGDPYTDLQISGYCMKTQFDQALQTPCCMGALAGELMSVTNFITGQTTSMAADLLACDARWCPYDQEGACEDVFLAQCSGSVSNDGGATWVSALLAEPATPLSACGLWYSQALAGQAPASRWPILDTLMENYCSANPQDTVSCGCFLYSGGANGTGVCEDGDCYLYTSVSQAGAINLRPVRPVDAVTSNTLNLSDYGCIAPQCRGTTLIPSDVWAMQHLNLCPDVCLQVVADGSVVISGDTVPGGIYVDISTLTCNGALASATVNMPYLMDVTDRIPIMWPHYSTCSTCCPASGCAITVPFVYALASNSADMQYTVTFDPPLSETPGVTLATPAATAGTLSWSSGPTVNVELEVAALNTPNGIYATTVTIADVRPQYATCRASTVLDLTVYQSDTSAPPQGPPPPNGGSGPPLITVYVAPTWVTYVLYGVLALAAILLLRQAVLSWQHASVKRTLLGVGAGVGDSVGVGADVGVGANAMSSYYYMPYMSSYGAS